MTSPTLSAVRGYDRIAAREAAPNFSVPDVNGDTVSVKAMRGQRVLLMFMRNVGCPVCNLRMHQLLEQAPWFAAHNLKVVAVYESTTEKMREYLEGVAVPFAMVPNPDESLYKMYDLEKSGGKAFASLFHGIVGKAMRGKKLFAKPMKQDGNATRIGAEFLIDEQGMVAVARYHRFVGDDLPIEDIKKFAAE